MCWAQLSNAQSQPVISCCTNHVLIHQEISITNLILNTPSPSSSPCLTAKPFSPATLATIMELHLPITAPSVIMIFMLAAPPCLKLARVKITSTSLSSFILLLHLSWVVMTQSSASMSVRELSQRTTGFTTDLNQTVIMSLI